MYTSIEVARYTSEEPLPDGLADAFREAGCPPTFDFGGERWAIRSSTEEQNGRWEEATWDEHDFFGYRPAAGSGGFVGDGTYYLLYCLSPLADPSTVEGAEKYGDWLDNLGHTVARRFVVAEMRNRAINANAESRAAWLRESGLLQKTDWWVRQQLEDVVVLTTRCG